MATLDTLCQITTITVVNTYHWVIEGLGAGQSIELAVKTSDAVNPRPPAGDGKFTIKFDTSTGIGGTADATGVCVIPIVDVLAHNYTDIVAYDVTVVRRKSPTDFPPASNRLTNTYGINVTSPYSQGPAYITVGNLAAFAGDTEVLLTWDVAVKCDARGTIEYDVGRSTSPIVGSNFGTVIATGLTSPSYLDTGRTNGVTYYYRVRAWINIGSELHGGPEGAGNASNLSNVVSAVPAGFVLSVSLDGTLVPTG